MGRMVAFVAGLLVVPSVSFAGSGSIQLIDDAGPKFVINTDLAVATSSASGACSEASYTHAVAAPTLDGGTTMYALNDAFDGFYGLIVDGTFFANNGPGAGKPAIGTECPGPTTSTNRQVVFNSQMIG